MRVAVLKKSFLFKLSAIFLCCLFVASVAVYFRYDALAVFASGRKVPVYSVDTDKRVVSLTFDAAWGADKTKGILDILDSYGIKATFFLVGFWVDNFPDMVKEFILTHHGTTCTAYFYNKYISEGGDKADADDFYYKGKKPTTKEQIIVMLCDTLEAASRSLKDYSARTMSDLVERIVKSKMADGQFEDADISLKELNIVKNVLKSYLQQVYHARIAYPKKMPRHRKP